MLGIKQRVEYLRVVSLNQHALFRLLSILILLVCTNSFLVAPYADAAREPKMVIGKLLESKLSEDQIFKLLTENVWENWPVDVHSYVVEKGAAEDYQESNHRLDDSLSFDPSGAVTFTRPKHMGDPQLNFKSKWNFRQTGPASGFIFLTAGDAWRFVFLQDGSLSISGNRYWKGKPKARSGGRKQLPPVEPSRLFKKLTQSDWYEQPEAFSPVVMHFDRNGSYSEHLLSTKEKRYTDEQRFPPMPFWSIESIPRAKVVFHKFDDTGFPVLAPWSASNIKVAADCESIVFDMQGASRNMTSKLESYSTPEISQEELCKILSSHKWRAAPKPGTTYTTMSTGKYGDQTGTSLAFGPAKLVCEQPHRNLTTSRFWNLKKDLPNGGWIFLEDGGALRFVVFRDGTISICGMRFFPWETTPSVSTAKTDLGPTPTFKRLTASQWVPANDFSGGVSTITFNDDGRFSETLKGEHREPKPFWSLDTLFYGRTFHVHDLDDFSPPWLILLKDDCIILDQRTLVPTSSDLTQGLAYGGFSNLTYRLTYKRPLIDKAQNKIHLEFSRNAHAERAMTSLNNLDKIRIQQWNLDAKRKDTGQPITSTIDLKGFPDKMPKSGEFNFFFDKTKPTRIRLSVEPKDGIFKTSLSDSLLYEP